jgi:hypothetical protein
MIYTPYDIYQVFKTVENEVKGKTAKIALEDTYDKRMSDKNKGLLQDIADLFNTKFTNVDLARYTKCGFDHFKGFGYDKYFREIVLNEYISRDARIKRNSKEGIANILETFKFIDRNLDIYVTEIDGDQRRILTDYIMNRVCSTVVVYCIWRNIWEPTDIEWEYMNVIKNNYPDFEQNVVKFAPMMDKWRKTIKTKKSK